MYKNHVLNNTMKSLLDSALAAIQGYIEKNHDGNVASAARSLDVSVPTLHTWLKGTRIPSFSKMAPLLEKIGAYIVSPDEKDISREVCFVDAKVAPAGEDLPPPPDEDYLAVPLVEEVGAGPLSGVTNEQFSINATLSPSCWVSTRLQWSQRSSRRISCSLTDRTKT